MKKLITFLLILCMLLSISACADKEGTAPETSTPETNAPSAETDPVETEADTENDVSIDAAYAQQIEKYYTAISGQWDEGAYFDNEMSALAAYYYDGNALDNVGYTLMDLDGDNSDELIIGAIMNSEKSPLIFEIWTLKDGEAVMLAQSGSRNRYYSRYDVEDEVWSIAYEAENGAANHAVYYLNLADGELEVIQGVVFDAIANENDPWFMAYDLDWDVSNDTPIDEDTANDVIEAGRNIYAAFDYIPLSQYK